MAEVIGDITVGQLMEELEDENLKAVWSTIKLPEGTTINEFFLKSLEAASLAAAALNENLEPGKRILGYPPATNGAIARAGSGQLFFPRSHTVNSRIVIELDGATPVMG